MKIGLRASSLALAAAAGIAVIAWTAPLSGQNLDSPVIVPVGSHAATLGSPRAPAAIVTQVIRQDIPATTVDSTATQRNNSQTGVPNKNLTLVPTDPSLRKGKLALFILGTNSSETLEQEIIYAAARRGYNAITLSYPNYDAVAVLCLGAADNDCTAKVREEMLTGVNLSTKVAVNPQDAIETRLRNLLIHLRGNYPSEGWGAFLSGNAINWSLVTAIGHSQGAGHVAYLAKLHSMYRATMLSGVADKTLAGATAPWLARANVTTLSKQYGFSHTADAVVPIATAEASWNAIGLATFGGLTSTDGVAAPYGGSHKLKTSLPPVGGANVHLSMADDNKMPRNADGTPAYEPVWDFMAFP